MSEPRLIAQLYDFTSQLISCNKVSDTFEALLDSVMSLHAADFGCVQIVDSEGLSARIVAQRGLSDGFLRAFASVSADLPCACGRALKLKSTVVIEDVENDPEFTPFVQIARDEGFRAVQTTPLMVGDGDLIALVSTFFRQPKLPSPANMTVTALYASHAAEILARLRREEAHSEQQELLANELSHRVKNVLTMVQAVSRESLRRAAGLADYKEDFEQRLSALGRAHAMLLESKWQNARLKDLVRQQMAAFGDVQMTLSGPDLRITANAAYVLVLALHELGVNAQKHGAFGAENGRLSISWRLHSGSRMICLLWKETGGPPVRKPTSYGFGSALFRNLKHSGMLSANFRYQPSGLVCALNLPASAVAPEESLVRVQRRDQRLRTG
ncbi:MAG TPA: HWE histidine kinase domain-containing protein [Pseudolabrys sp.]|nr:HWE histidine kinase domain-containing protein [Pseudolabrys sp.]